MNVAVDRMSLELLLALTSTGPGSMTNSPSIRVDGPQDRGRVQVEPVCRA
jgi:hypothetical protein